MFRMPKSLDVITLFHAPHKPASIRILNLLKQASADTAIADAAITPRKRPAPRRAPFELNITTDFPTGSQLETMLDYGLERGTPQMSSIVARARTKEDAIKLYEGNHDNFIRPMVVDWNRGQVVAGDKEEHLLKMLEVEMKETSGGGAGEEGKGQVEQ